MSGFDEGRVTWSDQGLADDTRSFGVSEFQDFIRQFQVGDEFPYRDQLKKNTNMHEYRLEVNLDDLMTFNPKLNDALREKPAELMPIFERAARDVYASMLVGRREDGETPPDVQVILTSTCNPVGMRDLAAKDYSKLVHIQGIVISASKPRVKATMITLQCKSCKKLVSVLVKPGLHGCSFPRACEGTPGADLQQKCPLDPFQVLSDRSKYVDLQTLKIQELPEQVPTGEMPRHMTVTLDRHLVGRVVPGAVISAAGIFTILNQKPRQAR